MSRFDTGNPIGSADPRDRDDNSKNLDEAVNDLNAETWIDRLGVERLTIQGALNRFNDVIIAGGQIFESEEAGRDAVQDGQYYYVVSDDPDVSRELWRRISETESELIAEDPSAEGLREALGIANAAIDLASQPSRLDSDLYNDDSPGYPYVIRTRTGQLLAAWGWDGYQITPVRSELYNDDSPVFFAITDSKNKPLLAIDEHRQYINQTRSELYNSDDSPDYCVVDANDNILYSWDEDGNYTIPGVTATSTGDSDYLTAALTGHSISHEQPVKLTNAEAIALSPAARDNNEWYFVDGVLLDRDSLPEYVAGAFNASADIQSGDALNAVADDVANVVTLRSRSTNLSGFSTRYLSAMISGIENKSPEFIIDNRSSWNSPRTLTRHRLLWSDDNDGDNWREFDNEIDDPDNNSWRFNNDVDFLLNRIYVCNIPQYTYQRHINVVKSWLRNKLVQRTESGDAAFKVGTCSARNSFYLNKPLPATPQYAFKIGSGDKIIVVTSGVHPDEKPGLYMLEGAVNLMLSNSELGRALRDEFTLYAYPAINSQGLYAGAQRWDAESGEDCNRIWGGDTQSELRTIYETAWEADLADKNVVAIFDYHSTAASNPLTTHARQLWYDVASPSAEAIEFVLDVEKSFSIERVQTTNTTSVAGYLAPEYNIDVQMTVEVSHDRNLNINDWRGYGALVINSINNVKQIF